jgi:8-oxo-dGTP pyrophosphatase MutT (NUDIX family)
MAMSCWSEQYRHGAGEVFLEIPGGSTDPGDNEPLTAGRRELLEETGFESPKWIACGYHFPNPALQSNKMYTFLALDCVRVAEPTPDPFEDIRVIEMPVKEVLARLESGSFTHSLIANSLWLARPHLKAFA